MKVRHITRALFFALLVASATLATSSEHSQSSPARVNAAAASGSSPVHEQPLPLPRVGLGAATGADGRVYAIGGTGPQNPHDPNTERDKERDLGVVEAYDPRRNTWACSTGDAASGCATHNLAPLPTPRHGFVVVAGADGHIYVIGGADVRGTRTVEAYDPRRNTWACSTGDAASGCATHNLAPLPTPRQRLAAALGGDGRLYVVGGYNPSRGYLGTVEAYAPVTNTWSTLASLPTPRGFLSAARGGDGRIYAIGGYNGRQALSTVEAYTAGSNTWTTAASLPAARDFAAAATGPGGQIYLLGGNDLTTAAYFDTVLVYNPRSDTWVTLPTPLSSARWNLAAAAHPNGLIYALGGIGDCLVDVACPTHSTATSTPTNTSTATSVSVPTNSTAGAAEQHAEHVSGAVGQWLGCSQGDRRRR
jgi:Kelch motif